MILFRELCYKKWNLEMKACRLQRLRVPIVISDCWRGRESTRIGPKNGNNGRDCVGEAMTVYMPITWHLIVLLETVRRDRESVQRQRPWECVEAVRVCRGHEGVQRLWECAEAVRVCRGRESLQRPWECVEAMRVCRGRESVKRLWEYCWGLKAWRTVVKRGLYEESEKNVK